MPPSPSSAIPRRPRRGRSSSMWWGPGSPTAGRTAPSRRSSRSTTSWATPCWARSGRSSTTPTSWMRKGDPVLGEIGEIVHDADLMDEKYARPESEGLDAIVRGMQLSLPDDLTLSVHTDVLYDGLYAYLSRDVF